LRKSVHPFRFLGAYPPAWIKPFHFAADPAGERAYIKMSHGADAAPSIAERIPHFPDIVSVGRKNTHARNNDSFHF
jgi:hypothetical protein